jgi:hypothetical protein
MSALPPIMRDQRQIDAGHLRLLAIFHFVIAGMACLGILLMAGEFMLMHVIMAHPETWTKPAQANAPDPATFIAIFQWFFAAFGLWFVASAVLNVMSGLFLRARKHRVFSLVVAGLNCLHMPLGTVLGIFTIIVLVRSSVQEEYEAHRTERQSA